MAPEFQHLEELPLAERIQLVGDLWDSIARTQGEDLPVPEWQKAELERRRQEYLRNPDAVMSWSEVKRSILESKGAENLTSSHRPDRISPTHSPGTNGRARD